MRTSIESIKQIFFRDLTSLEKEMEAYITESDIWFIDGEIKNSAGNLALHICGNLQHFVGAIIGQNGYARTRELEFETKNKPVTELLNEIGRTKSAIVEALNKISDSDLEKIYPIEVFGEPMTFSYFLVHLSGHLMYHLGQINYHRRLLAS